MGYTLPSSNVPSTAPDADVTGRRTTAERCRHQEDGDVAAFWLTDAIPDIDGAGRSEP